MRSVWLGLGALAAVICGGGASAQVRTIDPNQAIDGDISAQAYSTPPRAQASTQPSRPAYPQTPAQSEPVPVPPPPSSPQAPETRAEATMQAADTYERDDLLAAGEGVFGKGAAGRDGCVLACGREGG